MIDKELAPKVLKPEKEEVEDDRMFKQIFTLGELAQICPHRINKRLFLIMQSVIFQDVSCHFNYEFLLLPSYFIQLDKKRTKGETSSDGRSSQHSKQSDAKDHPSSMHVYPVQQTSSFGNRVSC